MKLYAADPDEIDYLKFRVLTDRALARSVDGEPVDVDEKYFRAVLEVLQDLGLSFTMTGEYVQALDRARRLLQQVRDALQFDPTLANDVDVFLTTQIPGGV